MASFLTSATKKVTDVRNFLRDSAGGSSVKYVAEKGSKHLLYIPFVSELVIEDQVEKTVKSLVALSAAVHEWQSMDGKFKNCVCLHDVVRLADDGVTQLNDGSCPFCDRVSDAWDIYNYRKEIEEANCKSTGDERKKHLEKVLGSVSDERKAKSARNYMYMLVVKFRLDASNKPIIGADELPEFDLKVMKMSVSKVDKLRSQIENSGLALEGCEIKIEYPNIDDKRLLSGQSVTSPIFPNAAITAIYPKLVDKINAEVGKFEWEGIEKAFQEFNGMTTMQAKSVVSELFVKWDSYRKEKLVNPSAKYMEYVTDTPLSNPALTTSIPSIVMPGGAPALPDANDVFGGGTPSAPSINI